MNVVHRDVTPRNVMVDEEGQVKVIDFGIAAPVATAPSGARRLRLAGPHAARADGRQGAHARPRTSSRSPCS